VPAGGAGPLSICLPLLGKGCVRTATLLPCNMLRYSTLSTGACVSILYGYFRYGRQQGPRVWSGGGAGSRAGSAALQALGLVGLSQLAPALQVPLSFGKAQPLTPSVGTAGGSADDGGRSGGLRLRCPMDFSAADVVSCSSRCRDVGC
jgi:hypothetical protein